MKVKLNVILEAAIAAGIDSGYIVLMNMMMTLQFIKLNKA